MDRGLGHPRGSNIPSSHPQKSSSFHSLLSRRRSEDRTGHYSPYLWRAKKIIMADINVPLCCSFLSILCVPFTSIYSTFLQIRQCHDYVLGDRGIRQVLCRELGCRGCYEDCDHAEWVVHLIWRINGPQSESQYLQGKWSVACRRRRTRQTEAVQKTIQLCTSGI